MKVSDKNFTVYNGKEQLYEDYFRFLAVNEKNLYGVVNSKGETEADFIYQNTRCTAPFYEKGENCSKHRHGLILKNTVTGKNDFLSMLEKDAVHKAENIIEFTYDDDDKPRKVKKTVTVPKYSDGEIMGQSLINGLIVDSPVGAIFTAELMSEETETKEIEVEQDSMDYLIDRPFRNNIGYIDEEQLENIKVILSLPEKQQNKVFGYAESLKDNK